MYIITIYLCVLLIYIISQFFPSRKPPGGSAYAGRVVARFGKCSNLSNTTNTLRNRSQK